VINKDGNGKKPNPNAFFSPSRMLQIFCNRSVTLIIFLTASYHCWSFTTSNVKRDLGMRDSKIYTRFGYGGF
jgi:hypothetical protein